MGKEISGNSPEPNRADVHRKLYIVFRIFLPEGSNGLYVCTLACTSKECMTEDR